MSDSFIKAVYTRTNDLTHLLNKLNIEDKSKTLYHRLHIIDLDKSVIDTLTKDLDLKFNINEEFHITLAYCPKKPDKETLKSWNEIDEFWKGKEKLNVKINVKKIAWNNKTTIALTDITSEQNIIKRWDNGILHITLGCMDGVKPVVSNDMLKEKHESIDIDLNFNGIIERIVKKR